MQKRNLIETLWAVRDKEFDVPIAYTYIKRNEIYSMFFSAIAGFIIGFIAANL